MRIPSYSFFHDQCPRQPVTHHNADQELHVPVLMGFKLLVSGVVTECDRGLQVGLLTTQPEHVFEGAAYLLNIEAEGGVGEDLVVLRHPLMVPGDDG